MTKTSNNVRHMVLCAMFTALVAVCSQIAVPMPWGLRYFLSPRTYR